MGQHGLLGKQNMYEHSVSVPLIVRGPGVPAGEKIEQLSLTYDIYPTLCELAEISVPESVESSSLLPLIRGNKSTLHETVYSHYKDIQRMVSDGRWKLIRYFKAAKDGVGSERIQLFYLVNDPWELADVSADHPREVECLQDELAQWMREIGDPLYKDAIRPLSGKDTMAFNKLMPPPK